MYPSAGSQGIGMIASQQRTHIHKCTHMHTHQHAHLQTFASNFYNGRKKMQPQRNAFSFEINFFNDNYYSRQVLIDIAILICSSSIKYTPQAQADNLMLPFLLADSPLQAQPYATSTIYIIIMQHKLCVILDCLISHIVIQTTMHTCIKTRPIKTVANLALQHELCGTEI